MNADEYPALKERQGAILRRALLRRVVRVRELASDLGVHEMTIRRDLDELAGQGHLERIHGGARLSERTSEEQSHQLRAAQNREAKEAIALAGLALIEPGDVVALDASTTSLALARMLRGRDATAIVTSLDAANALAAGGVPFLLAGGAFHPPARSFVGTLVERSLDRLRPDKAFFSAKGFTLDGGFMDPHLPEAEVKSRLIQGAGSVVALVDGSKFGRTALAQIAPSDGVDALVTDVPPEPGLAAALAGRGVRVVVAPAPGGS